jgi:hypothetical protein
MGWTFYNSSGEALTSFGPVALTDLDIDGGTDIGEAIVDADLFIIDNGAGGTNVKTAASRIKTYAGVTQAVLSDIVAETNQDTYTPPDLILHSPGVAKAWVTFNGSTEAVLDSYNVTDISDEADGDKGINFTKNMGNVNYVGGAFAVGGSASIAGDNPAAAVLRIQTYATGTSTLANNTRTFAFAFGDRVA